MPINLRFLGLVPVILAALSGCNKSAPAPAGMSAGAQVLPGTISDAMVDLDRSQSHPLLNPDQSKHKTAGEIMGEDASDSADTSAPPLIDTPAPKATPTD